MKRMLLLVLSVIGWEAISQIAGDEKYLITVTKHIEISSPVDIVWETHIDINNWSNWHPDISSSKLSGEPEPEKVFL